MADKPRYSTIQQHQPLYAPKGWNEEEKRFVQTLKGIFEDIYRRYGRLGLNDLSKVFRGTMNGLESNVNSVQGSVTTLADAFEQLNAALGRLNASKLAKTEVLDAVYPIGSLYMSVNAADPGTLFGGTWEQLKDRFLLAAGDAYAAGATGGEASHTLTANEMPAHQHYNSPDGGGHSYLWGPKQGTVYVDGTTATGGQASGGNPLYTVQNEWNKTSIVGGNAAHNNMPPYLAVWVWKRTA